MSTSKRPPGSGKHGDDAWQAVSRSTRETLRGDDIGDTRERLTQPHHDGLSVAESADEASTHEVVELLSRSIKESPQRSDLWMMRFQMYRSLAMKPEFEQALRAAWAHPTVRRNLDWRGAKGLWAALAPGEPLPAGIELVESAHAPGDSDASLDRLHAPVRTIQRRFSDQALQSAELSLSALDKAYAALRAGPDFFEQAAQAIGPALGRPTSLHFAQALTRAGGGAARIYLKREDQRHMAPEVENAVAQAYVARQLGRRLLVSGSDTEAHAQALAVVASRFGMACQIHVRPRQLEEQAEAMDKLRQLGAVLVATADETEDTRRAALRHWQQAEGDSFLALSLGTGPRPYPMIVSDFQSLLGRETDRQLASVAGAARPRCYVAALNGEADAVGFVLPQLAQRERELFFVEPPAGTEIASRRSGWLRAYNGLKREHAALRASGRLRFVAIGDAQARAAQEQLEAAENIRVSLEDARAVAQGCLLSRILSRPTDLIVLVA